ncbi:PAS domain-containing protein [Kiloniella laminariae]|uniref:PAS domain-containing protein n=1 Tax=Kiloniella laminariae TaxID=454162 RepID=A0ABT4LFQ7_9PROT|nr:PAS domain-containing protein [Kiloniella laminariae]MCZ4279940.1 PAS domain-containing protein [Kiloniella laminariae]
MSPLIQDKISGARNEPDVADVNDEGLLIQSPVLRGLLSYWQSLPLKQDLPLKASFDPLSVPRQIWPQLFLCQLFYEPFSVLIRLQGTYLNDKLHQQFTGKYIDETTFGASASKVLRAYQRAALKRVGYLSQERLCFGEGFGVFLEAIHLPLLDEKGQVSHMLGALERLPCQADCLDNFTPRRRDIPRQSSEEPLCRPPRPGSFLNQFSRPD